MTFVELDLHKRYITACALDAAGGVIGEVRRMPVSLESITLTTQALASLSPPDDSFLSPAT